MKRIQEIKISNFKAFRDEQVFNIRGKNMLVFGNNGSGKSSLFWALYTLLQSSLKDNAEIQKYFKLFDEGNSTTHQSLLNTFDNYNAPSYIQLTTIDDNKKLETFRISHDNINTNLKSNTIISELNEASDFINYKLLHNFYRGSHKVEVNLWPVFERDIFPFLTDNFGNPLLSSIIEKTSDVNRTSNGKIVSRNQKDNNIANLNSLNTEIEVLLNQIENNANDFIKKHFFNNKDVIKINLQFSKKFTFDKVKKKLWDDDNTALRQSELQIRLIVGVYDEKTNSWKVLHRVQSFLNEAQLTRIAIGIRIGALRTRVQTTDFKVLVLDDMLISLDMSNRLEVIKMILNLDNNPDLKFFDDFQKIILTHDKGFYELVKRHTSPHQWEYFTFHSDESNNDPPKIKIDRTRLEKAQSFLADGEYDAAGNEIRKETEELLHKYLKGLTDAANDGKFIPLNDQLNSALKKITATERRDFNKLFANKSISKNLVEKIKTDYSSNSSLSPAEKGKLTSLKNRLFDYLIKQYEIQVDKEKILDETKDILQRIMNPASHASLTSLYGTELQQAIDLVKELKIILQR